MDLLWPTEAFHLVHVKIGLSLNCLFNSTTLAEALRWGYKALDGTMEYRADQDDP